MAARTRCGRLAPTVGGCGRLDPVRYALRGLHSAALRPITIDNISDAECNTTTCTTDDTSTADVTVTYSEKPASGTLSLTGPKVISSEVVNVSGTDATSYTFIGVEMLADGGDIDLTATFSEGCSYSDDEIGTAPECSVELIPSDITVSGFGCFGPNGTYSFVDYAEGAPFWQSMSDFVIG